MPGRTRERAGPIVREWRCLVCRGPIESDGSLVETCPRCGHANSGVERRIYWTREMRFIALERIAKAIIIAITLAGILLFVSGLRVRSVSAGYVYLLPVFLAVGLWMTASKLTAWVPYFSARIFWTAFLAIAGLVLLGVHWAAGLAGLAGAAGVYALAGALAAWRKRYVAGER